MKHGVMIVGPLVLLLMAYTSLEGSGLYLWTFYDANVRGDPMLAVAWITFYLLYLVHQLTSMLWEALSWIVIQ